MDLTALLEDLERRLDPAVEDELEAAWLDFLAGRGRDPVFNPRRARAAPPAPGVDWPTVHINDTLAPDAVDAMVAQQLAGASAMLAAGGGGSLGVRPNYGVPTLPSVFGAELVVMERRFDTLPTCRALAGGSEAMETLVRRGPPDPETGLGGLALAATRRFKALFADYPKVNRYVQLFHPDLQGPMDVLELLWGSDIFVALYEEPELVKSALDVVTDAYAALMDRWLGVARPRADMNPHWGCWYPGRILIRDDSAMNLSPAMYAAFIRPWNERLFDRFGAGAVHACGKVDHWLPEASAMKGLRAFNMSQPEYNDLETVFRCTLDRGIPLVGLRADTAQAALESGRDLHHLVHTSG